MLQVCIAGSLCGCAHGEKRSSPGDICRSVEAWNIVLWVVRKDNEKLAYTDILANPRHSVTKDFVQRFENGVGQCYPNTALANAFVIAEVSFFFNLFNLINIFFEITAKILVIFF